MKNYDANKDGKIDQSEAGDLCNETWKYLCWLDSNLTDAAAQQGPNYPFDQAFFFFTKSNEPDAFINHEQLRAGFMTMLNNTREAK